jgi:ubiquinol-cytochrome c reductase cytochrome c subunit
VSRLRIAIGGAALVTLAWAALALAQPPSGIVHPTHETTTSDARLGAELYAANCSSCHGLAGGGIYGRALPGAGDVPGRGPSLRGVGALAADFYLSTGRMPLGRATEVPDRHRVEFNSRELRALTAYVASLGGGPPIPSPDPAAGDVGKGRESFESHCAGCHQIEAQGGYVTNVRVPPLQQATPRQIAEAVRVGPYLMPRFSQAQISDSELNSVIAYVLTTRHPPDRGGWGIGNIGPVPEGMVTWLIAAIAFISLCLVIGRRGTSE